MEYSVQGLNSYNNNSTIHFNVQAICLLNFPFCSKIFFSLLFLNDSNYFFKFPHHTNVRINKIIIVVNFTFIISFIPAIVFVTYIVW